MKWQLRLHLGVEYLPPPVTLYPKAKRTFRQQRFNLEELRLLLIDQKTLGVAKLYTPIVLTTLEGLDWEALILAFSKT